MNLDRFRGSNNFLIWIVLIVIALGFGKCGNPFGINAFSTDTCGEGKKSRRHYKGNYCNTKPICKPGTGIGGFNGLFAGNGLFIILVIVLLILCKDEKKDCNDDIVVSVEDEVDEVDY
jgi:hypothetical protein